MGLDAGFLSMLEASVVLEKRTDKDKWGNEQYAAPTTERAFIGAVVSGYGEGEVGGQREGKAVRRVDIIMDAVGVTMESRVSFDGDQWYVTQVETVKDEVGNDLYQNVTVEDQKKG